MTEKYSPFEEESGNVEADIKYDDVVKSISKAIDPSALVQIQYQYQPSESLIFQQSAIPLATMGTTMGMNSGVNAGGNWNTFANVSGCFDGYATEEEKTYEFKLVDGTKTMKTMSYRDIKNIVEFSTSRLRFSWKFPFFRKETRRITHVDFFTDPRSLDVDCNMSMFMTMVGRQYVSWNKALMTESVKHGTETN